MTSKIYKNFGGGGKKLTRKNRKYLMKLYRKNRTRKHRGGGKAGKPRTVSWAEIYWNELDSILDDAVSQLRNRYGIEEYDEEATKLENLRVHEMAASNPKKNIQLVKQLKKLRKTVRNNAYEITLNEKQNEFLDQFYTDTPCCVISGGGKIDDSDGRIRLYKTTEELSKAQEEANKDLLNPKVVNQQYLTNIYLKNRYTDKEKTIQMWLSEEELNKKFIDDKLETIRHEENMRRSRGETMMNTLFSDEVNKDWELYEAAWALVSDKTKPPTMFTGNFHEFRPKGRVAFADSDILIPPKGDKPAEDDLQGGGEKKPTFESTKQTLKRILMKIKPDNEHREMTQKQLLNLDKVDEKKFNVFVKKIYENFDKIMKIPIKSQTGGMERPKRRSPRLMGDMAEASEGCPICLEQFNRLSRPERRENAVNCAGTCNRWFHKDCVRDMQYNRCPMGCNIQFPFSAFPRSINNRFSDEYLHQQAIHGETFIERLAIDVMLLWEVEEQQQQQQQQEVRNRNIHNLNLTIKIIWIFLLFIYLFIEVFSSESSFPAAYFGFFLINEIWSDVPDNIRRFLIRLFFRLIEWAESDEGRAILGLIHLMGGKKTRRKRYKRKKRTKRKMRKKRGGMKIGDMVKKKYKMDKLDEYGNPTGKKFWKDFKGLVQNIDNEGNTTIYWYADKSTDVLTKIQSNSLKVIQPKPVAIGDMHQADIPPLTGVSYTGDEKFNPLPAHELTHAIKPTGYVSGIPKGKDDGFEGTREWGQKMLAKLKSYD